MAIKWHKEEPLANELIRLIRDVQKAKKKEGTAAAKVVAPKPAPAPAVASPRRVAPAFVAPPRPAPAPAVAPAKKRERRSDLMIAALGITLGLICAMFPWYIFFNPEQFGIRAVKFEGNGGGEVSGPIASGPERVGAPMSIEEPPQTQLDLFATGTLPAEGEGDGNRAASALDQPFPVEEPFFKIIHVENGRAMVEDESGLWIVQRGSALPDSSRIASIEERGGRWVVVTNRDRVIEVTP